MQKAGRLLSITYRVTERAAATGPTRERSSQRNTAQAERSVGGTQPNAIRSSAGCERRRFQFASRLSGGVDAGEYENDCGSGSDAEVMASGLLFRLNHAQAVFQLGAG